MNALAFTLVPALLLTLAGLVFAVVEWRRERARADGLVQDLARAEARAAAIELAHVRAAEILRAQAAEQAQAAADKLAQRAEEALRNQERLTQARLAEQLKPVADTLGKFEQQVQAIEKARAEDTGGLKAQIAALMAASRATQEEARKLSAALRRGAGVQGRWGEQALRNVLETAGLNSRFDFQEQASVDTEEGRLRPDVIVRLPGGGVFVVDAKASLTAFLEAQEAIDDAAREAALIRHAASLKAHVQGLSAKAYWDQFDASPDFVAMFVPGDGILAAALERAPDLMGEAMDRRVLIVTPTTLFALCKAVAYGWRVEEQALNAREIAELGRELYKRLADMGGHVAGLGKSLGAAVDKFNAFVGSLEGRVLSQARRFEELKVEHEGKAIPELEALETAPRALSKLAAEEAPALAGE
jgi:DNA recombination protein RmuC